MNEFDYEDEKWSVEPKAVAYDVEELRERYRESGLLEAGEAVPKAFLLRCETVQDAAKLFYRFALSKVGKDALDQGEFIPGDVWREAEGEFPWEKYAE